MSGPRVPPRAMFTVQIAKGTPIFDANAAAKSMAWAECSVPSVAHSIFFMAFLL